MDFVWECCKCVGDTIDMYLYLDNLRMSFVITGNNYGYVQFASFGKCKTCVDHGNQRVDSGHLQIYREYGLKTLHSMNNTKWKFVIPSYIIIATPSSLFFYKP